METQKLILAEDVFDAIEDGKLCTIRNGRRDIKLDKLVFESLTEKRIANATVHTVMFCALQDIPEGLFMNDGFKSVDDMLRKMKRFYPEITLESECTVVIFYLND
jgi:hypothetical protein